MRERQLTDDELSEIQANLESGMRILSGKHGDLDPGDPGKTMSYLLEEISSDSIFLPEAVAVLMDCLERAVDWKPVVLEGERFSGKAMVSPDGSYATYPELVIGKAMRNPEESNLLLFFNMIEAGSLPPSSVDRYTILS
jgi:hypothetical protein